MLPLFDLSLQLNGFPMKEAKAELRKIVSLSEKEHEAFLENKKVVLLLIFLLTIPAVCGCYAPPTILLANSVNHVFAFILCYLRIVILASSSS